MTKFLVGLLAAAVLAVPSAAQTAQTLRVNVELMQTVATVTDFAGRYVTDLKPDEFDIELNGESQTIAHFTQDQDTLVSLGLVLDYSSSMRLKFDAARRAAVQFVRGKRPLDQIFLMVFAGESELKQDFTDSTQRLIDSLADIKRFGSGTDLKSAIYAAALQAKNGIHRKKAVVVITDAGDTSEISLDYFRSEIRKTEMLVYALHIIGKEPNPTLAPTEAERVELLDVIANETGGRWFPLNADDKRSALQTQLDEALAQITAELRAQYSIGFYPSTTSVAGRHLSIRMRDSSKYKVRWRPAQ